MPGSSDHKSHWVIYTVGTDYAHGTGPHYGTDVYASNQDNKRPVAYFGPGKLAIPPTTKSLYVHSWWSSDKVQSFTVRKEA